MKCGFWVSLCLLALPLVDAHASRWIIKNPGVLPRNFVILGELSFDGERFVSIELPDGAPDCAPEGASPDFEIGPLGGEAPIQSLLGPTRPEAWFVKHLRYEELPANADGHGVVVAVLDDGVKLHHPALFSQMWVNPRELAGNKKDDDGNGYVDDVYGYDFVERKGDPQGRFSASHGTFCAGLIAATRESKSESKTAAQGVAPGARIMALRILGGPASLQPMLLSNAAEAIKYAVDNGAQIVSNSWRIYSSWQDYKPTPENLGILESALRYAEKRGVIFVAGAGNESLDVGIPGSDIGIPVALPGHSNMVGVAASDENDARATFSNFGMGFIHFAAPGTNMVSTETDDTWGKGSGTSYSTPLVAGILARGLSAGMSPTAAIQKLRETSQVSAQWQGKIDAGGVVDLVQYLK
ncbi:S8 family serine peptidase [Bdellovibrionota bacterium FG-2]